MKGLERLIRCVGEIRQPCELQIHGVVTDAAYWARCRRLVDILPVNIRVAYLGEFEPVALPDILDNADVFVLLTEGENFGHAIAEAMSRGCPVALSEATLWTEVARQGGGCASDRDDVIAAYLAKVADESPVARVARRVSTLRAYSRWYQETQDSSDFFELAMGAPD